MLHRCDCAFSPVRRALALSAITLGFAAAAPAVASADLWVASGGTDSGYCSQANPCATVSRAVSLAIPHATIYIGPGRFQEHVTDDVSDLHLQGAGMHATTLSGGSDGSGRVLTLEDPAEVDDLTITGGSAPSGAGVFSYGGLTMNRVDITGNDATGGGYGNGAGGGLLSAGDASISDSAITVNEATGSGGGIAELATTGSLTLRRDLIASNTSAAVGGSSSNVRGAGVFSATFATLDSDTIVDNLNPGGIGGGADLAGANMTHDTIAGNVAVSGAGVNADAIHAYGVSVALDSSVLSSNRGGNCSDVTSAHGDLTDDTTCPGTSNLSGDPQLGPLADHGGPTETMAIPAASPAYDASSDCAGTDERGVSLLQRGATSCDIGAYQVDAPATYVADYGTGAVDAYALDAAGNTAPTISISGSATGLKDPMGVATDDAGDVFVADATENSISEFAPETTGNVAPIRVISGPDTQLNQPQDLTIGNDGSLYVTNLASSAITEYSPSAHGDASPVSVISGAATNLRTPTGIVLGPDGKLHVASPPRTILTFSTSQSGNTAPQGALTSSSLSVPRGLSFDPSGRLVVASSSNHKVFTFGSTGTVPAISLTITGYPIGVDLDLAGDTFMTDPSNHEVLEFAPGATTPSHTIAGSATGLGSPGFLSELPPTPAPQIRISGVARTTRQRFLASGATIRVRARGRLAFRDRPVIAAAVARERGRQIAVSRSTALRPGATTVTLAPTRSAAQLLKRHRHTAIVVTVTVHDAGGAQRRQLTVTSAG